MSYDSLTHSYPNQWQEYLGPCSLLSFADWTKGFNVEITTTLVNAVFLQSDHMATIFLLLDFVWLLFEGGVYFFRKSADINNGWTRYVIYWGLLDTVSSTRSLSVPLSAMETSCTTQTNLALAQWPWSDTIRACMRVLHILAAATIEGGIYSLRASDCLATIQGWRLFHSELLIVWLLFEGDIYSKKYGTLLSAQGMMFPLNISLYTLSGLSLHSSSLLTIVLLLKCKNLFILL